MFGCYCRVRPDDQSLERQLTATNEYAIEQLGADLVDVKTYRDKSTGTDTSRDGYRSLMEVVEGGDVEVVVAKSVSRIARSIRDLDRTAERVTEAGAELHIVDEGLIMKPDVDNPYQNALFRLPGVFAQLDEPKGLDVKAEMDEYYGTPINHGRLYPNLDVLVEKGLVEKGKKDDRTNE